jgi:hypothetical protein
VLLNNCVRERKRTPERNKRLRKSSGLAAPIVKREKHPTLQSVPLAQAPPPIGMPKGVPITMGSVDSFDWMRARGVVPGNHHWFVEVALSTCDEPLVQWSDDMDTRLHVYIYPSEWGFLFCHQGRGSWIRVADRAHVHGRDDFGLVDSTPPLREIASLLSRLESSHTMQLRRDHVLVRTNLSDIEGSVRDWVLAL